MFDVQFKPGIEAVNLIKMDTFIYGVSYEGSMFEVKRFLFGWRFRVSGFSNKKSQITNHKYQTNHNDRNSKFKTIRGIRSKEKG